MQMDLQAEEKHSSLSDLKTPFIHQVAGNLEDVTNVVDQPEKVVLLSKDEILREVKKQLKLALPLISVNFFVYSLQVISVMFVGHLGELPLAGASMATSFASVTGFSLLIGMGSALDTLCGQSYGAKQYHMLGIHLQRAIFILLLTCIPLTIIWSNTHHILIFFGQDPEISSAAGTYATFMIPSMFAYALFQCQVRFLQAQNNVVPMMVTTGLTTMLHVLICWLMVFKSGFGYKGAAIANGVSYWINVLLLGSYVRLSGSCERCWNGFKVEGFFEVGMFLRLAVPSAVMICLEVWMFEMMVLLSGLLPNPKLETSVLSISLNTCSMFYMIPLGLSGAVSTRVSNELGAGKSEAALRAVCIAFVLVVTEGILVVSILMLGHNVWGYCYSREARVVKYVGQMLFFIAGSHFIDAIQSILSGSLRGCGRQKIGAYVNLGSYYLVGVPCALLLAFMYHFGGKGLWMGLTAGLFVQASALFIITVQTNWKLEAKKANERVHEYIPSKQTS